MSNKPNVDQIAVKAVEDKINTELKPFACINNAQLRVFGIELFKQGYRKFDEELTKIQCGLKWNEHQKDKFYKELTLITDMLQRWEAAAFEPNSRMYDTAEALIQALRDHYESDQHNSTSTLHDLIVDWCKSVYGENYGGFKTPEGRIRALRNRFENSLSVSNNKIKQKDKIIAEYHKEFARLNGRVNELKKALHEIGSLHQTLIGVDDSLNNYSYKQIRDIIDKVQMSVETDVVDLKQLRLNRVKYTPNMIDQIMDWYNGSLERIEKGEFELHDNKVSQLAALYQVSKEAIIEARDYTWKTGEYNNP